MARKSRRNNINEIVKAEITSDIYKPKMATAVYARLSSEKENDSIQTQVKMLMDFISSNDEMEHVGTYVDDGFTGTNFDRPDFNRLMSDVRSGRINCIVVKDLSRFGRNFLEVGYYIETLFPGLNVRLIAINDNFDSYCETDRNNIAIPIKNIVNEYYAKDFSRRTSTYIELHRELGDSKIIKSSYGYKRDIDNNTLIPDPETAQIVRVIFHWYILGYKPGEIAKRLNMLQIDTPRTTERKYHGKTDIPHEEWSSPKVQGIIKNSMYIGDITWHKHYKALYKNIKSHNVPKEDWIVWHDMHEPLVSKDIFDQAQQIMKAIGQKNRPKPEIYGLRDDPFSGLVHCGECGRSLILRKAGKETWQVGRHYQCNRVAQKNVCRVDMHMDNLKMIVMNQIQILIKTMCDQKELYEKLKQRIEKEKRINPLENEIQQIKFEIQQKNEKLAQLYEDMATGVVDNEDYKMIKAQYLNDRELMLDKLSTVEQKQLEIVGNIEKHNDILKNLSAYLNDYSFDRKLVYELIEDIKVYRDNRVEIVFSVEDGYAKAIAELEKCL